MRKSAIETVDLPEHRISTHTKHLYGFTNTDFGLRTPRLCSRTNGRWLHCTPYILVIPALKQPNARVPVSFSASWVTTSPMITYLGFFLRVRCSHFQKEMSISANEQSRQRKIP